MVNAHSKIVETPVAFALEEIRPAVAVLEGGIDIVADAAPHRHISGVVQLDMVGVFVESVNRR